MSKFLWDCIELYKGLRKWDGRLFFDESEKVMFLVDGRDLICSFCNKKIRHEVRMAFRFAPGIIFQLLLCPSCRNKVRPRLGDAMFRDCIIVSEVGDDWQPIFLTRISKSDRKQIDTVQAVFDRSTRADHIIDRTRYAGRESWHGVKIGAPDMDLIEKKDCPVSVEEGLSYLEKLSKAEPVIPHVERKVIEKDGKKVVKITAHKPDGLLSDKTVKRGGINGEDARGRI